MSDESLVGGPDSYDCSAISELLIRALNLSHTHTHETRQKNKLDREALRRQVLNQDEFFGLFDQAVGGLLHLQVLGRQQVHDVSILCQQKERARA